MSDRLDIVKDPLDLVQCNYNLRGTLVGFADHMCQGRSLS